VVDRSHELIDLGGRIEVGGELAAPSRALQWQVVAPALLVEVSGPENGSERRVVLCLPEQGLENGACVGSGEEMGQLAQVAAQVAG